MDGIKISSTAIDFHNLFNSSDFMMRGIYALDHCDIKKLDFPLHGNYHEGCFRVYVKGPNYLLTRGSIRTVSYTHLTLPTTPYV